MGQEKPVSLKRCQKKTLGKKRIKKAKLGHEGLLSDYFIKFHTRNRQSMPYAVPWQKTSIRQVSEIGRV